MSEQFLKRITAAHTWSDLSVGPAVIAQLKDIAAHLSNGKGGIALLTGPSGTGKTLSANVIANALKMDLYRVDLASVVSKYIGETEKNLNRLFEEARGANAILLFDEADALFGKPTEIRDAHDRYTNLETGHLLQRLEEYPGLAILSSNLSNVFDDAFIRRVSWVIDFPSPRQRLSIWRRILTWFGL